MLSVQTQAIPRGVLLCHLLGVAVGTAYAQEATAEPTPPLHPGLPRWKHTYKMSESTIIMSTNYGGWLDIEAHKGWGVIDIDWSDGMVYWGKGSPIEADPAKFEQVRKLRKVLPASTKLMIYRNSAYGYNWDAPVRTILDDKAYADWFIQFAPGNTHWPRCDTGEPGADPAKKKCSDAFHAIGWGPSCPFGGGVPGKCHANQSYCEKNSDGVPVCNCGDNPCGFYLFNHSTSTVVKGQTFQDWFIKDYMYHGVQQLSDKDVINGFYWDDAWNPVTGGFVMDPINYELTDTGLGNSSDSTKGANSRAKVVAAAYRENMIALNRHVIEQGMFAWNMLWTGTGPALSASDPFSSSYTEEAYLSPVVQNVATCAAQLRVMCKDYNAPPHTRAMGYGIDFPGYNRVPDPEEALRSLANFLLIRGKYGYIGHGWNGRQARGSPAEVYGGGPTKYGKYWEADYGEPLGLCEEEENQSGVFTRKWSKGTVTMDCNTWVPTFELNA